MPLIHVNAGTTGLEMHEGPDDPALIFRDYLEPGGPVIIMVHGFRYAPGHVSECPHRQILALDPVRTTPRITSWPRGLGFGLGRADEGLGIAFGWQARGTIWQAYAEAERAGARLAELILWIRQRAEDRPIHAIAHSLGARVLLCALTHLPEAAVNRLILLCGAEFVGRAKDSLASAAGRSCELINITSRQNDFFDVLFETLISARLQGERCLGRDRPEGTNVLNLRLDAPDTPTALSKLGFSVPAPKARICHWSPYTLPGIFPVYNALLRDPDTLSLASLRTLMPQDMSPRREHLLARPPDHCVVQ